MVDNAGDHAVVVGKACGARPGAGQRYLTKRSALAGAHARSPQRSDNPSDGAGSRSAT
jgi:hypothetical protein